MSDALRVLHACDWHLKYATWLSRGMAETGQSVTLLTRDHDEEFAGVPGEMARFVADQSGGRFEHLQVPGRVREPQAVPALVRLRRSLRGRAFASSSSPVGV